MTRRTSPSDASPGTREPLGRAVRRRPGPRPSPPCPRAPTSTGASRRRTSPGSRAHARVLHAAGLLSEDHLAGMLAGLDQLEADVALRRLHTGRGRRGRAHRARARSHRAGRARPRRAAARRPLAQRPDRHALPDVPARARPRRRRTRARRRGCARGAGRPAPRRRHARSHPPAARAAGAALAPPARPRLGPAA